MLDFGPHPIPKNVAVFARAAAATDFMTFIRPRGANTLGIFLLSAGGNGGAGASGAAASSRIGGGGGGSGSYLNWLGPISVLPEVLYIYTGLENNTSISIEPTTIAAVKLLGAPNGANGNAGGAGGGSGGAGSTPNIASHSPLSIHGMFTSVAGVAGGNGGAAGSAGTSTTVLNNHILAGGNGGSGVTSTDVPGVNSLSNVNEIIPSILSTNAASAPAGFWSWRPYCGSGGGGGGSVNSGTGGAGGAGAFGCGGGGGGAGTTGGAGGVGGSGLVVISWW